MNFESDNQSAPISTADQRRANVERQSHGAEEAGSVLDSVIASTPKFKDDGLYLPDASHGMHVSRPKSLARILNGE